MEICAKLDQLLAERDAAGAAAVGRRSRRAPIHEKLKKDFEEKVRFMEHISPWRESARSARSRIKVGR